MVFSRPGIEDISRDGTSLIGWSPKASVRSRETKRFPFGIVHGPITGLDFLGYIGPQLPDRKWVRQTFVTETGVVQGWTVRSSCGRTEEQGRDCDQSRVSGRFTRQTTLLHDRH